MGAPTLEGIPPPAPAAVPAQLFDDSPAAPELVLPLKGRRLGVYWRAFEDATPEVVAACRHAVGALEEHGCEVGARCPTRCLWAKMVQPHFCLRPRDRPDLHCKAGGGGFGACQTLRPGP